MKKYLLGAKFHHASERSLKDIFTTPQGYCSPGATDIFEASAQENTIILILFILC